MSTEEEGDSSTEEEAHAPGCDRKAPQKKVEQRWWLPGKRHRRQLNLLLFQDDQLRLALAAVVVDLAWSWAPMHVQRSATPTGSIVPRAARYNARTMRPSLLSRFLHNSVVGLPAPSRIFLLSVVALGLNTNAAKARMSSWRAFRLRSSTRGRHRPHGSRLTAAP